MRTIELKVTGKEVTIYEKKEITKGACDDVEDLLPSLFFDAFDVSKFGQGTPGKSGKRKVNIEKEILIQLLSDKMQFVKFLRVTNGDPRYLDIILVILRTKIGHDEIGQLPQLDYLQLLDECKKRISSAEDFINGLGIDIKSAMERMLGMMVEMPQTEG